MPKTKELARRSDLPFVRVDRGVTNHWAVTSSGDAKQDYQIGFSHGRQAIAFGEQWEDSTQLVVDVIREIVAAGRFGPLELGFVDAVAIGALLHQNSMRTGHIEKPQPGVL